MAMWERVEDRMRAKREVVRRKPIKKPPVTPVWKIERLIRVLDKIHKKPRQLLTAIWPAGTRSLEVVKELREELGSAKKLEFGEEREAIESNLRRALRFLEQFPDQKLETGLALFINAKEKWLKYIVPPHPLSTSKLEHSHRFLTELVWPHLKKERRYGLIVLSKREAAIGYIEGADVVALKKLESPTLGETRKGGASASRFRRIREELVHEHFKRVADHANRLLSRKRLNGIIIGGPGEAKQRFCGENYLKPEMASKIVGVFSTSNVKDYGLSELVLRARDLMV
jgi:peptide chain release factor subunit 1